MKVVRQTLAPENQNYWNPRENKGVIFGSGSPTLLHHDTSILESISSCYKDISKLISVGWNRGSFLSLSSQNFDSYETLTDSHQETKRNDPKHV